MKGVLSLILWKSARSKGQPAALDMASRCSTALVLPPRAMTVVMAFSNALGVIMSRGLMSCFSSSSKALQHRSGMNSVGAAAAWSHDYCDDVLECLGCHDVRGLDVLLQ